MIRALRSFRRDARGAVVIETAFAAPVLALAQPMPVDAIFRIRSETKPVTGVAMMILYEEDRACFGRMPICLWRGLR